MDDMDESRDKSLNLYGDQRLALADGRGADIASQRLDDLDRAALGYLDEWPCSSLPVRVMDVGCGVGGLAVEFAAAGAEFVGVDVIDFGAEFEPRRREAAKRAKQRGLGWGGMRFVQADMTALPEALLADCQGQIWAMVCQRTIHYLPYPAASRTVRTFSRLLAPGGRLFISASGLESELGTGYGAGALPVESRFGRLAPEMAQRHEIRRQVCLYREAELAGLLEGAGFEVLALYSSAFGNVKAIAGVQGG